MSIPRFVIALLLVTALAAAARAQPPGDALPGDPASEGDQPGEDEQAAEEPPGDERDETDDETEAEDEAETEDDGGAGEDDEAEEDEEEPRVTLAEPSTESPRHPAAEVGWSAGTIGGIGRRPDGAGAPAWFAGADVGYAGIVVGGTEARLGFFGGVRAVAYGLDDLREPNRDEAYVGFGALIAMPIHLGSPDISFLLRPSTGILVSRESTFNSAAWILAGAHFGVALRIARDVRLTVELGAEAWFPFTQATTTGFLGFRLGLESTWRGDGRVERRVSVAELLREYETEHFADLVDGNPAGECVVASVPSDWRSIRDEGAGGARCEGEVLGEIPVGRCALFVGVAHNTTANVDMRAFGGAARWERLEATDAASSDEVGDHWPVNVICNFTGGQMSPVVEVRRLTAEAVPMTVRRYDVVFDRPTRELPLVPAPRNIAPDGEIAAGTCGVLHLPGAGDHAMVRLPAGDSVVRVMAPAIARVAASVRRDTVRRTARLGAAEMRSDAPFRVDAATPSTQPFLLLEAPIIGTAVVVCVDAVSEDGRGRDVPTGSDEASMSADLGSRRRGAGLGRPRERVRERRAALRPHLDHRQHIRSARAGRSKGVMSGNQRGATPPQ